MDKCGWRCARSTTTHIHIQGLAGRAGKLLQARNTGEAYRLVRELGGVTRGGPPLAQRISTGALVFWPAIVPSTAEHFAGVLSAINPVAEDRLLQIPNTHAAAPPPSHCSSGLKQHMCYQKTAL